MWCQTKQNKQKDNSKKDNNTNYDAGIMLHTKEKQKKKKVYGIQKKRKQNTTQPNKNKNKQKLNPKPTKTQSFYEWKLWFVYKQNEYKQQSTCFANQNNSMLTQHVRKCVCVYVCSGDCANKKKFSLKRLQI